MSHRLGKEYGDVYIFYTHHKDTTGTVVLTELKLSSFNSYWAINFKSKTEETIFTLCKTALKMAPIAKRSYDDTTKIWSYFDDWGVKTIAHAQALASTLGQSIDAVEVEDLQSLSQNRSFNLKAKKIKPEDFFYQTETPPASKQLSATEIKKQLSVLLEVDEAVLVAAETGELKKLYRRAALRLHPDRNNGDGAQMSSLNMLWGMYNG